MMRESLINAKFRVAEWRVNFRVDLRKGGESLKIVIIAFGFYVSGALNLLNLKKKTRLLRANVERRIKNSNCYSYYTIDICCDERFLREPISISTEVSGKKNVVKNSVCMTKI